MLTLNVTPDNAYLTRDRKELYLYIDLKAGKAAVKAERTPLNLSLVIDRSGSMSGDKIRYAREAAKFLINNLEPADNLSLVIYDDEVDVLSPSARVVNKDALRKLIDGVNDRGSTNLSGGMLEGYSQVKKTYEKSRINRVLLLSDGLANQGITDEKVLQEIAKKKTTEENMTLSAFGIGADFNEILMTNLAEYGSGNYYFIDSPDKIPTIFAQELKGLLSVVAQNTSLRLRFPNGPLRVSKVFGYPYRQEGNELVFDIKDVFSEEQKAILIKFTLPEAPTGDLLFETSLAYDDAATFQRMNVSQKNTVKLTTDTELFSRSFAAEVMQNIVLFESNELLEQTMLDVDKGEYERAKQTVGAGKREMAEKMKKLPNSPELDRQFKMLEAYESQIDSVKVMSNQDKQMLQKSNRSGNYSIRKKK